MYTTRKRGILLSLAGAFWAAAYLIPYRAASVRVGAEGLVLPMLLAAAVLHTPVLFLRPEKHSGSGRLALGVALLLGALAALGNESMAHALQSISAGIAAVILRSQVILVAMLGWWLLGERVGLRFWLGTCLAIGGFILLQGGTGGGSDQSATGMAWAGLAVTCFASMQVIVRRTVARIDPLRVNCIRLWMAAVIVAFVPGRLAHLVDVDWRIWLLAGAAALFGPVFSRICLMFALRHIQAALSTLLLFAAPVFAFVLGGIFFSEWPSLIEIGACVVIMTGIALPVTERTPAAAPGEGGP